MQAMTSKPRMHATVQACSTVRSAFRILQHRDGCRGRAMHRERHLCRGKPAKRLELHQFLSLPSQFFPAPGSRSHQPICCPQQRASPLEGSLSALSAAISQLRLPPGQQTLHDLARLEQGRCVVGGCFVEVCRAPKTQSGPLRRPTYGLVAGFPATIGSADQQPRCCPPRVSAIGCLFGGQPRPTDGFSFSAHRSELVQ